MILSLSEPPVNMYRDDLHQHKIFNSMKNIEILLKNNQSKCWALDQTVDAAESASVCRQNNLENVFSIYWIEISIHSIHPSIKKTLFCFLMAEFKKGA